MVPYVDLVDARWAAKGEPRLSFFEVLTVMAYAAFADAPVDVAVSRSGWAARGTPPTRADGEVAMITPIGIDHVRYLGETSRTSPR